MCSAMAAVWSTSFSVALLMPARRSLRGIPKRECAGFVENDSVDAAELLEVKPTFRDDAATRSASDSREDGERRTGCYTTHAPATMITAIVEVKLRVTISVNAAAPNAK